jgi:hypothetical protein
VGIQASLGSILALLAASGPQGKTMTNSPVPSRLLRSALGTRVFLTALAVALAVALGTAHPAAGRELSVEDFTFDGPFGSQGATVEKLGPNHFKVSLGHAPGHVDWCNMLQFQILQGAKGNRLRLDVCFQRGNAYRFNHYPHSSWSYDGENWQPIGWQEGTTDSRQGDTLLFPEFSEDTVYFGHQVPMSYEDVVERMARWAKHPHASVHVLGKSLPKAPTRETSAGATMSPISIRASTTRSGGWWA